MHRRTAGICLFFIATILYLAQAAIDGYFEFYRNTRTFATLALIVGIGYLVWAEVLDRQNRP